MSDKNRTIKPKMQPNMNRAKLFFSPNTEYNIELFYLQKCLHIALAVIT